MSGPFFPLMGTISAPQGAPRDRFLTSASIHPSLTCPTSRQEGARLIQPRNQVNGTPRYRQHPEASSHSAKEGRYAPSLRSTQSWALETHPQVQVLDSEMVRSWSKAEHLHPNPASYHPPLLCYPWFDCDDYHSNLEVVTPNDSTFPPCLLGTWNVKQKNIVGTFSLSEIRTKYLSSAWPFCRCVYKMIRSQSSFFLNNFRTSAHVKRL